MYEATSFADETLRCSRIKVKDDVMEIGQRNREIEISLRFHYLGLLGENRDVQSFKPCRWETSVFKHQGYM
ncbi:hypothetical protein J1N35_021082 [Gossypium stocksii]|uniref:Uncharacterized protein n=1 Tax=Gossypium stocksii TaxID=47602 RepID=A0A9D3ZZV3_9ROSI|nr:hypothetical protein J1N35_021082 [Gossypium stocksii]